MKANSRRLAVDLAPADHKKVKMAALEFDVPVSELLKEILWRHGLIEEAPPKTVLTKLDSSEVPTLAA